MLEGVIFFEKVTRLHFFGTESWSESPQTIKIKEISSRAFERCGREPHTTRYDPVMVRRGGWPAGVFLFVCFGSTNACFVLRAAPTALLFWEIQLSFTWQTMEGYFG